MVSTAPLSADGPLLSDLVYGTWRILDDFAPPSSHELVHRFETCLELGITTIDTAEIYGEYKVEETIGKAFKAKPDLRDKLTVVTKCGIDIPSAEKGHARVCHYNASADNIVHCAEKSLQLLHLDKIDLFLVHRPDWMTSADDTAAGLNRLLKEGKILHAGVSNYTASQFDLLNDRMDKPLVTNQVQISVLAMDALYDGTLSQCERLRIRPMAWSPLGGGRLFNPENKAAIRVRECMEDMRPRYGGAQDDTLAFAWVMAHPSKPVAIVGTNRIERIKSAAEASEIVLERQDWYALWEASKGESVP